MSELAWGSVRNELRESGCEGGMTVLSGEKILITGPAGRIAFGLARSLVADNEVWGIARFGDPQTREKVDAIGVTTRALDISSGDFGDLPTDFTYLLHIAADFNRDNYDQALRVNAEGTGFVMEHCRKAKAALVMSTVTVYKPHPDGLHPFARRRPARRRDVHRPWRRTRSRRSPKKGWRGTAPGRSTCRPSSLAWARRTAIRVVSRSATSMPSPQGSRYTPAATR